MARFAALATRRHEPWSICVMDFAAGEAGTVAGLSAYFHADTSDSSAFAASLPRPPGEKETLPITADLTAVAYDRERPWQRIEWLAQPGALTVGFGEGSLRQAWEAPAAAPAPWTACREVLGGDAPRVATIWLNLNELRRAMPGRFTETPTGRALAACGIANARGLLLAATPAPRAEDEPGLYTLSLAYSARSEPPDAAHRTYLTEIAWPADLAYPDGVTWAIALRADWGDWIDAALRVWQEAADDREQRARQARRNAWIAGHGGGLAGLMRMSAPWVVISGGAGGLELRCDFTGGPDRFHAYARGVFGFLGLPRFDPVAKTWRWPLGASGIEWGAGGRTLIARPTQQPPR